MGDSFDLGRVAAGGKPATLTLPDGASTPPADATAIAPVPASLTEPLRLEAPTPPQQLSEDDALALVRVERESIARLDVIVAEFIVAIMKLDTRDPKLAERSTDVRNLGNDALRDSSEIAARLLERTVGWLVRGGPAASSSINDGIVALRREADRLNPRDRGDLAGSRKLLGFIPMGDKINAYFARYQSSQADVNAVLLGLQVSQVDLRQDNVNLERDRVKLVSVISDLRHFVYLAQRLDATLAERVLRSDGSDPERARIMRDDMLASVRMKHHDLSSHLALAVQSYLTVAVMERNNLELIRGLEAAKVAILSAMRTAIAVAQSMIDLRLVLDQITMLNDAALGSAVPNAASGDLSPLQLAFEGVYRRVDEIDAWRSASTVAMTATGVALQSLADRTKGAPQRSTRGAR